jgi:hypothetical protein
MNIFIAYVESGQAATESDLRRIFWSLAKKTHPDATGIDSDSEVFKKIKEDYDASLEYLKKKNREPVKKGPAGTHRITKDECIDIFLELIASNFPIDRSIREKNSIYLQRMARLNGGIALLDPSRKDLLLAFEQELYGLRGDSVISNHPYTMVKLFLYRYLDYRQFSNANNRRYIVQNRDAIFALFEEKGMRASASFLQWLLET